MTFQDSNASAAEPQAGGGGIGDVTSTARGSGARFNAGKAPVELIPLRLIAESFSALGMERQVEVDTIDALRALGDFQVTGDRRFLTTALECVGDYWIECARVFDYGRGKYAAWNWAKGMSWASVLGCAGRHAVALLGGEDDDRESGLPHIGHLACNVVMLATFADTYPEGDDLPPRELFRSRVATAGVDVTAEALVIDAEFVDIGEAGFSMGGNPQDDHVETAPRSVVVFGPRECGKTRNSVALASFFGLSTIQDDWDGSQPFPRHGVLVLTNTLHDLAPTRGAEVFLFDSAMSLMKAGKA